MLLRPTADGGIIAIPQPAHAWLAGNLARAWGNAAFQLPTPLQEVYCATSLHDVGWLTWESDPQIDPTTGWPQTFAAVPAEVHTTFWREGIKRAEIYGAYAAVLVSMHGDTIYDRTFDAKTARPEAAVAVRAFQADQKIFQKKTIEAIRRDPILAPDASDAQFRFNKRFIASVDRMSLRLCWGLDQTGVATFPETPVSLTEDVVITFEDDGKGGIAVHPWPFAADEVEVRVQGRKLTQRFADQASLSVALKQASPATVVTILHPKR
jgi:hypothetical protein